MSSGVTSLLRDGHYPYRAVIDAYGNGGFRFADMSHRGSLLILPTGMHAWPVTTVDDITTSVAEAIVRQLRVPEFVLLGTGARQIFPSLEVRRVFEAQKIGVDVMDTGAACRTYNILLGEQRPVMCALIAV